MLETLDPFAIKEKLDRYNVLVEELGDLRQDIRFLRALRRAVLPVPFLERRGALDAAIFPPLAPKPHPALAGKRVGLVASGGSGVLVALCGVKRALEEADIEVAALSVCSGSAIWGSMIGAGMDAQQMVDLCFGWAPVDIVDIDWPALAKLPLTLGRSFRGLMRGEALERTLERAYRGLTLGRMKLPYYTNLLNLDTNEYGYFGPEDHPEVPLARMVHAAIALPVLVQPVELDGHHYADGGVVDIFPVAPLLDRQKLDFLIGVNVIMPAGFRGEDIHGWQNEPLALLKASRQLYHSQWLELARRQLLRAGDRMLLLEPLPYSEICGTKFFDVFLDNSRWPSLILQAYRNTKERLATVGQADGA